MKDCQFPSFQIRKVTGTETGQQRSDEAEEQDDQLDPAEKCERERDVDSGDEMSPDLPSSSSEEEGDEPPALALNRRSGQRNAASNVVLQSAPTPQSNLLQRERSTVFVIGGA